MHDTYTIWGYSSCVVLFWKHPLSKCLLSCLFNSWQIIIGMNRNVNHIRISACNCGLFSSESLVMRCSCCLLSPGKFISMLQVQTLFKKHFNQWRQKLQNNKDNTLCNFKSERSSGSPNVKYYQLIMVIYLSKKASLSIRNKNARTHSQNWNYLHAATLHEITEEALDILGNLSLIRYLVPQ